MQETDQVEEGKKEMKEETGQSHNLLRVVASPAVQEKLYKEASCIIPRSLAEILIHHYPHMQDLQQLL